MEVIELAAKMATGAGNPKRSESGNYYMTNINHPVIFALMRRYCEDKKINLHTPMSDKQRLEFELWLFQPSIRKMVEKLVGEVDARQITQPKN